jgi:prevent-host-death family protein
MDNLNATQARSQLFRLMDEVAENHRPILITGKRNNSVLISQDDWEAIQETLYLLSIPGMGESIQAGMATPISECATELDW